MSKYVGAAVLFVSLVLVAGCGGGPVPASPPRQSADAAFSQFTGLSSVTSGNFTEYALPARANPSDLARGPYDTLYFPSTLPPSNSAKLYQMLDSNGALHTIAYTPPIQSSGNDAVIGYLGAVWFFVVQQGEEDLAQFIPGFGTQIHDTGVKERQFSNIVIGGDGNLWFGFCADPCSSPTAGTVISMHRTGLIYAVVHLDNYFTVTYGTPGPNGLYFTASYTGPPPIPNPDTFVYVISAATDKVVNRFGLPNGSAAKGIATGPDHNLWIAEPGINKIARMTPSGTLTQYALPTANAKPDRIIENGALFFTETTANKIGRITTSGSITEYAIPTANSGASGLTVCPKTYCGAHGGVWFTEKTANKIGKFNSPL